MNRFLIPKISRQVLKGYMPLGILYFLIFMFIAHDRVQDTHFLVMSYDAAGIFWALVLALFLAGHFFWVLFFPGSKSREEIRFLSTLPVSRKRIVRNDITIFIYVNARLISLTLVVGFLLLLQGLLTGLQLLGIIIACLWFATGTLFVYLISRTLTNGFFRIAVFLLSIFLCFTPVMWFLTMPGNAASALKVLIVCSIILTGISLLIQRYNENKFLNQDLL